MSNNVIEFRTRRVVEEGERLEWVNTEDLECFQCECGCQEFTVLAAGDEILGECLYCGSLNLLK
jgi:hypothetical protein